MVNHLRKWGALISFLMAVLSLVAAGIYGNSSYHSNLVLGISNASPNPSGPSPNPSGTSSNLSGTSSNLSGTSPNLSGASPNQSGTSSNLSGTPNQSGSSPNQSIASPDLLAALPDAVRFELLFKNPNGDNFLYMGKKIDGNPAGYVTTTETQGEWGPMLVVTGWSLNGTILYVDVPKHNEVMAWFRYLYKDGFFTQYIGRQYSDPLYLFADIDAVTGSTISSDAVAVGVRQGRDMVALQLYNDAHPVSPDSPVTPVSPVSPVSPFPPPDPVSPVSPKSIPFGVREFLLLGGICSVVVLRQVSWLRKFTWTRYVTLAFGMAVLGFWLLIPISLVNFAVWMVGFTPSWQSALPLYILVFSMVILVIFLGKNFYCLWLCPFGAVQEGMHLITGSQITPTLKWRQRLSKIPFALLWLALFLTLLFHSPSVSSFEPWGAFFSLRGSTGQWLLLAVTLIGALIVHNFWCLYLCPVGALFDTILWLRRLPGKLLQKSETV